MPFRFEQCSDVVSRLSDAAAALETAVRSFELPPLAGREWFEVLNRKLKPQLGDESFLIVAVVGGTNIGKSVVFNHIAGERVSSTSPLASGTKHPTALVPTELLNRVNLDDLFPGFETRAWENSDQPLREDDRHLLFWRESASAPSNLIILDTPDVDSVAQVNWERADHVRQGADVLVALLTQQKYNDAAVKEFFRKAAREDKLVIVIFNQCLLPEDEDYWPLWVQTFCEETGVAPHALYLAPNDRRAAEENTLPFFERQMPGTPPREVTDGLHGSGSRGTRPAESADAAPSREPRSLMVDLSELRFGEIKVRTLSGALKQLVDPGHGVPSWLREIDQRAEQFGHALELMSADRLVKIEGWPTLPNSVMILQIRHWWHGQRGGWSAHVHNFYNRAGEFVSYPVRALRERTGRERVPPVEAYRAREWETVLEVFKRAVDRLEELRDLRNPLLSPRLDAILGGASRKERIRRIEAEHRKVDFEGELKSLIEDELAHFREENPKSYALFRRLDTLGAAARPAVSVGLFMSGAGLAGEMLTHVVADVVVGTVATAVGDKTIAAGASSGMGYLEAKFRQLHARFAAQRASWMAAQLERHLLGSLPQELGESAAIARRAEYGAVQELLEELRGLIRLPSIRSSESEV